MDKQQELAVNEAFIRLFEEGLIERRKSLVNWSCALESAISDIEVDTLQLQGATELSVPGYAQNITFGRLYDIAYKLWNSEEEIVVSTTRPETLLGDVAVAVHPADERFLKYRQQNNIVQLRHPFRNEPIPLIFDIAVDAQFGTGAVKITPAHDRHDFELAQRHLLQDKALQVFNEQGSIVTGYEGFENMPRFLARERMLQKLAEMSLLRGVKNHAMNLPICSRSKDVIEYMLRSQWFLHCQPMADAAISELQSGRLQILPPNFETEWFRWLHECHDWCISRQLWWGHQIPAYHVEQLQQPKKSSWVAAHSEDEALKKATAVLQTPGEQLKLTRDADVLDTWFSSALLPFSAFGWPLPEYAQSYPLDLMQTGHDILFFWVARMVMLGLKLTGQAPFNKILLNGIVCDAHGRKMSKSLGNVITPQQVVQGASLQSLQQELQQACNSGILNDTELQKSLSGIKKMFPQGIPECGTDALRFTLCSHNIKSHFINFDISECHTNKLFLNKAWQATRFTLGAADRLRMPLHEIESMNEVALGKWDLWILSRLASTLKICAESFENYNLHNATAALKAFLYGNLCDVYVEISKANINAGNHSGYLHCATLTTCLSWSLQAMSPFTPYIAAELSQHLPQDIQLSLNRFYNQPLEQEIATILEICQNVRQLKSRSKISKKHEPHLHLLAQTQAAHDILQQHLNEIQALSLANNVSLQLLENAKPSGYRVFSTAGHLCSFGINTNDSYEQIQEQNSNAKNLNQKKLLKLEQTLANYRLRYESEGFRKSASEHVQKKHFEKMQALEIEISNIKSMTS